MLTRFHLIPTTKGRSLSVQTDGVVLVYLFAAFLVIVSSVAGPVAAQATPQPNGTNATANESTTPTAANNTTIQTNASNSSANGTDSDNSSSTSIDAASDTGSSASGSENATNTTSTSGGGFLDPWGYASDMITGAAESAREGISGFIDSFNAIFAGFPAPGSLDNFAQNMVTPISPLYGDGWSPPDNGMWRGVATTYVLLSWVTIPILLLFLNGTFAKTPAEQRDMVPRAVAALFLVFFGFPLLSLLYHLVDAMILTLVPSGSEFMASPEGTAKFGLGALFGAGLILSNASLAGIAVLVLLMFYLAVHVTVLVWPLAMLAWAAPITIINYVAYAEFAAIMMLIVIRLIQGLITRTLFEIDIAPITSGPVESAAGVVVSTVLTIVGLWIAFVTVPKLGVQKIIPAIQMPVGDRAAKRANEISEKARERVPSADELHEKVFTARDGKDTDSGTTPRAIGSVSNSRSSGAMVGSPSGNGSDARPVADSGTSAGTNDRDESGTSPNSGGLDAEKEQKRIDRQRREINKGYQ